MVQQNNIIIPLNERAESVLLEIIRKYNLEESEKEAFEKNDAQKPFNETIVIQSIRDLLTEKISNKEFLDTLYRELKIPKEAVKNMAIDIMDDLVPLLEKISEDQLKNYNKNKSEKKEITIKDSESQKEEFREKLLNKIRSNAPIQVPKENPIQNYPKKTGIVDVEKNAEKMEKEGKNIITKEKNKFIKENTLPQKLEAEKDTYREPIE